MSVSPHRPPTGAAAERRKRTVAGPVVGYLESLRAWADELGRPPAGAVADLARVLGRSEGWPVEAWSGLPAEPGPSTPPTPPPALVGPHLLGQAYEALLAPADRRRRGAFFTPPAVAGRLVEIALDGRAGASVKLPQVGDPSVGGGAFLLAAAEQLTRSNSAKPDRNVAGRIVREALWGADVDAEAVAVTRLALAWWAWRRQPTDSWPLDAGRRVVVADALLDDRAWSIEAGQDGGPGAVVGNPPFLGQLKGPTARSPEAAARLRQRYGRAARGYVDTAALFLLAACRQAPPGTRVVLILPEPALVAAHASRVRDEVLARSRLLGLWLGGSEVFRAGVRVCAPVLEVGTPHRVGGGDAPAIWAGPAVEPASPVEVERTALADGPTWGPLTARHRGVPQCRPPGKGTVADLALATAGFRDEYYGLAPHVGEAEAGGLEGRPQLVTSGLIEPARSAWGRREVRFAGRGWNAPVVDLDGLRQSTPRVARWVEARLRPKLLVATQSTVLEAVADPQGNCIPSVPVVSVEPRDEADLWRLLAVLISPVATAWALERYGGAGLSASALKLSAKQLLCIPLPCRCDLWDAAARSCQAASEQTDEHLWRIDLGATARLINGAYDLDEDASDRLLSWWTARLPHTPLTRHFAPMTNPSTV